MTPGVFAALLLAAALHASWNAIIKASGDKRLSAVGIAAAGALVSLILLPFFPAPAVESWPFVALSTLLQIVYYRLVARTYQAADMSQAYPVMRGTAPLLIALASILWLGERLSALAWAGIAVICASILGMALTGRRAGREGLRLALATAGVIACYTLVDATGVRRSGAPVSYTLWIFLTTGVAFTLLEARGRFAAVAVQLWQVRWWALAGGLGTLLSYGIALWAMTRAPVAMVAALRETAILFGVVISVGLLGERAGRGRIIAACGIALGAVLLRLA